MTDRLNEEFQEAIWPLDKSEILDGNKLKVQIRVDPNTEKSGKVAIGDMSDRLFSNDLFADVPVDRRIRNFVESAFGDIGQRIKSG